MRCRREHASVLDMLVAEGVMAARLVRANPVTVNDVLDGHVNLDLECLDRVYLHGFLAQLQVGGQVVQFLRHNVPGSLAGVSDPAPRASEQVNAHLHWSG
jgi:hypothetical protein